MDAPSTLELSYHEHHLAPNIPRKARYRANHNKQGYTRMPKFYEQFYDPTMDVDMGWNPEQECEAQALRLENLALIFYHTKSTKRRLGQDASPAELSADKKISKSMYNRAVTLLANWAGKDRADAVPDKYQDEINDPDTDPSDYHRQGAQIDWSAFWAQHKPWLQDEIRRVVTHAYKTGSKKTANIMANRFQNEYQSFADVLEDEI